MKFNTQATQSLRKRLASDPSGINKRSSGHKSIDGFDTRNMSSHPDPLDAPPPVSILVYLKVSTTNILMPGSCSTMRVGSAYTIIRDIQASGRDGNRRSVRRRRGRDRNRNWSVRRVHLKEKFHPC